MPLTKLQSIIYFELSSSQVPLTGYQLTKLIGAKGLNISHQQIYRESKRMPVITETILQTSKPDKITMRLDPTSVIEIDCRNWPIEVFIAYPIAQYVTEKIQHIESLIHTTSQSKQTPMQQFTLSKLRFEHQALSAL